MLENLIKDLTNVGLEYSKEITNSLENYFYPTDYNPKKDFLEHKHTRQKFIEILQSKSLLSSDISDQYAVEIGGGICCTGAAFSDKCKIAIAFELGKVHCYYAKICKEHYGINNLAIFHGSIFPIGEYNYYTLKNNTIDIVISHLGMFRDTIIPSLANIYKMIKKNGVFIIVYPRFWTNSRNLNPTDNKLLSRAIEKNKHWFDFNHSFGTELSNLGFKIVFKGMMNDYSQLPMGGDIIVGSNIASSKEEYYKNPISDLVFGKTKITCNTLICEKI